MFSIARARDTSFHHKSLERCANSKDSGGHRGGVQRRYYPNNQMQEEFYIQFNRLEGVFRRWDVNGNLKRETVWQNGVCIQDSGLI